MTDKEIIQALELCITKKNCTENCPYVDLKPNCFYCIEKSTLDAIDLINRQQAEIEQKDKQIEELVDFQRFCKKKAIKEFADRLKEKAKPFLAADILGTDDIDDLMKEMVGADNE